MGNAVERVVTKLQGVTKKTEDQYVARCPVPSHGDRTASLSIARGKEGRALVKCFAGCPLEEILEAIGLSKADLFESRKTRKAKTRSNGRRVGGCTLEQLAERKKLPVEHLLKLGWRDGTWAGAPAVFVPYRKRDGSLGRTRVRINLTDENPDGRFRWGNPKVEIIAYEPDGGSSARGSGAIMLVEGETDVAAGSICGYPMLGIPGADFVKKTLTKEHLEGVKTVAYVREPGSGGATFALTIYEHLGTLGFKGGIREIMFRGAKDVCELHAQHPGPDALRAALAESLDDAHWIHLVEPQADTKEATASNSKATASHATDDAGPTQPAASWSSSLAVNRKGDPKPSLENVLNVLQLHPAWEGVLAYDAFRNEEVKLVPPPVREIDGSSAAGPWEDGDTVRTVAWISTEAGFDAPIHLVEKAVQHVAKRKEVHEIRDYLRALSWDGVRRLDELLPQYFGVISTDYARAIGPRIAIAAVARVMQPGCQVDHVLVLEGDQGMGKSSSLKAFIGPNYYSDTGITIGQKDAILSLRGKWMYDFSELDALTRVEINRVKAFITTCVDNVRLPYGHRNQDVSRQCVFVSTTNERIYLPDQTGNRRFWPVACVRPIDVQKIRDDRDQLWAEAYARYRAGEVWHVNTPHLRELCEEAQRDRQIADPWIGPVDAWLHLPAQQLHLADRTAGITTAAVLEEALKMRPGDMARAHETRAGQVLRCCGLEPRQLRVDGSRVRRYFVKGSPQLSQLDDFEGRDEKSEFGRRSEPLSQPSQPDLYDTESREEKDAPGVKVDERSVRVEGADGGADQVVTVVTGVPPDDEIDLEADDDDAHDQGQKVAE